ncbi:ChrR cupin-like domain-containing protein [Hyaloraphidium curvatum]|nr:ChrR cupin-like domain-containing protein [Hyaloraphidium curvatum]
MDPLLNADYSLPCSSRHPHPSATSPSPSVVRYPLDRVGDEVARATSLVRYLPGGSFPPHTHGGGEEFLVLEGEFGDEHGLYPSGSYVRNPVGSRHNPRVGPSGCLILVKLRWMRGDEPYVSWSADTRELRTESPYPAVGGSWPPVDLPPGTPEEKGATTVYYSPKSKSGTERVRIVELGTGPGQVRAFDVPRKEIDSGGIEILVLDGSVSFDGEAWGRWDWVRRPATSKAGRIALAWEEDAKVFVKTGYQEGWTAEV